MCPPIAVPAKSRGAYLRAPPGPKTALSAPGATTVSMLCSHVTAGALDSQRFVLDDRDRGDLVRRLAGLARGGLLAYCIMDTHVHAVVEGSGERACARARGVFSGYTRAFNARRGRSGPLLRGAVHAATARTARELARQISYVHDNPLRTKPPIVTRAHHFEWSSARAFVGLSRAPFANVSRALELMGDERRWVVPARPALEGLTPALSPSSSVELLLAAGAQTFGVASCDLSGSSLAPEVVAARAVYVALGRLEGYLDVQLAAPLGRTDRRVSQIALGPVDLVGVRIGRTLLRNAALRSRFAK
jgi:hypothetical protein